MNAARRAEVPFSLVRASEKADHANDTKLPKLTGRELEILPKPTRRELEILPKPTRRELEILRLSATGERSQAIADALYISKRTVDFHFANLFRKWGVKRRLQALKLARERGLLSA